MSSSAAVCLGYWFTACHTLLAQEPTAYWPTGNQECPCIDPWTQGLQQNNHAPRAVENGCTITRPADHHCYNSDYGSRGCHRYDWTATPECAREQKKELWCNAMWCYVDPTSCSRDFSTSQQFPNATFRAASSPLPLTFSYETCGYIDTYSEDRALKVLIETASNRPSGKLRVAFPSNSGTDYTVVGPPKVEAGQGVGGTNRSGSVLLFMEDLFAKYGIPWEVVAISSRSKDFSPNSLWTACVHEVAIGNADMCWGNFWPTASRQMLTTFASSLYDDKFYAIVFKQETEMTFWQSVMNPFTPFSLKLWLATLLVLGYAGVTMSYENSADTHTRLWKLFMLFPSGVVKGWHAIFTGEVGGVEVTHFGGWLAACAVGFAVMVLITGYTAVVTTNLMSSKQSNVRNLQEGIIKGFTFCADSNLHELLLAQYPELQPYLKEASVTDALNKMDNGICDGVIIHDDLWYGARSRNENHCDGKTAKVKLPNSVVTLANSIPVRNDLVAAISFAIAKEVEAGRYIQYQKQARLEFRKPACQEIAWEEEKTQFTVWDMASPLLFLLVMSTLSMVVSFIGTRIHRRVEMLESDLDEDGDGRVSASELIRWNPSKTFSKRPTGSIGAVPENQNNESTILETLSC